MAVLCAFLLVEVRSFQASPRYSAARQPMFTELQGGLQRHFKCTVTACVCVCVGAVACLLIYYTLFYFNYFNANHAARLESSLSGGE